MSEKSKASDDAKSPSPTASENENNDEKPENNENEANGNNENEANGNNENEANGNNENEANGNNEKEANGNNEPENDKKEAEGNDEQPENNENSENAGDKPQKKIGPYPVQVFFILGNEFCERFSYYGLRTVLTLFLSQELEYSDSVATIIFHSCVLLAYFTPLIGAVIADAWLGRFRTIFYISIIYAIGNIVVSVGSIPMDKSKMAIVSLIGLTLIGIGTGGIKPCVSAFGGDQYREDQVSERIHFFMLFYFVINLGSFFSTILTPIFREDVHCFGEDTCYFLAFGVPSILMFVSLIVFVLGKPLYTMVPVRGSVFFDVFKCIGHALSQKAKSKGEKKDHWLDYAEDEYSKKQIQDIKILMNVLFLFIPLPIFWCLFEQQSSTWIIQATKMDGKVMGFVIKPDQMQVVNPTCILILIPIFNYGVYPLLAKCNLLQTSLRRMQVGMLLTALSFVMAGLIEVNLEETLPEKPNKGNAEVRFVNNSPCKINITGAASKTLNAFEEAEEKYLKIKQATSWQFEPSDCDVKSGVKKTFTMKDPLQTMMITAASKELEVMMTNDTRDKPKSGQPTVRILFATDFKFTKGKNDSFQFRGSGELNIIPDKLSNDSKAGMTEYCAVKPGKYQIYIPHNSTAFLNFPVGEHDFLVGGTYIVVIYHDESKNTTKFRVDETVKHNSVTILLQIPPTIVLTAGEILLSITGLEFAYSQAPEDLKSIVQAGWLLTDAFGNLIYVIIKEAVGEATKQSMQFFLFAAIMAVDTLIFAIFSYFYVYVEHQEDLGS